MKKTTDDVAVMAAPEPVWLVLIKEWRDVQPGRLVLVDAEQADKLTPVTARIATPTDISIGASLARDFTKKGTKS